MKLNIGTCILNPMVNINYANIVNVVLMHNMYWFMILLLLFFFYYQNIFTNGNKINWYLNDDCDYNQRSLLIN